LKGGIQRTFTQKIVIEMLHLSGEAKDELQKIDKIDFDIFRLRDKTENNELVTILTYLITHKGILG
jgi:hypothetical protein